MRYLRNLGRRKVRTTLTVLGITIGIWALVVFGSMANKINALVEGGSSYYADKISVSDSTGGIGGFSSAPMSLAMADRVRAVDGVDVVAPAVMMLMDDQVSTVNMGVPPMITGSLAGSDEGRDTFPSAVCAGSSAHARRRGHVRDRARFRHRPQVREAGRGHHRAEGQQFHGRGRPRADADRSRPGSRRPAPGRTGAVRHDPAADGP